MYVSLPNDQQGKKIILKSVWDSSLLLLLLLRATVISFPSLARFLPLRNVPQALAVRRRWWWGDITKRATQTGKTLNVCRKTKTSIKTERKQVCYMHECVNQCSCGFRVGAWKRTKLLHSPIFILFYDFPLTFFFSLVMLPLKWYFKVRVFLYSAWSSSFLVLGFSFLLAMYRFSGIYWNIWFHSNTWNIFVKHTHSVACSSHTSQEENRNENEPKYCGCIGVDATRLPATLFSFRSMVRDEAASVGSLSKSLSAAKNKSKKKAKHVRVSSALWSYAVLVLLMLQRLLLHRVHVFFWKRYKVNLP